MLHFISPCSVTSTYQGFWSVSSCFVTNETNETEHQWQLLLVCFICFILFQSILEFSLYILNVSSVSVMEKNVPQKNLCGFCAVYAQKRGFDISCKLSPFLSSGDNLHIRDILHAMSNPLFWGKIRKIFQNVIC